MAIEVKIGEKRKIILDFWTSDRNQKEYLSLREFFLHRGGKWLPDTKKGVLYTIEIWNSVIPRLREMIYYKTAPPGAPPFESDEEGKTFEDHGEPPGDDF